MATTRKRKHRLSVSDRAKNLSGGSSKKTVRRTRGMRLIPRRINKKTRAFTKKDFHSGDGMLTTVWGPSMWHVMHTMSFNYPVSPTQEQKKDYMDFIQIDTSNYFYFTPLSAQ